MLYGYLPAFIVSDFNFVGDASTLLKKGSSEFVIFDINDSRDILLKNLNLINKTRLFLSLESAVNVSFMTNLT